MDSLNDYVFTLLPVCRDYDKKNIHVIIQSHGGGINAFECHWTVDLLESNLSPVKYYTILIK